MWSADKHRDLGLLLLRMGIGAAFVAHGLPKMLGGPALWRSLGGALEHLGITFAPTFFGFMAAFAELGGGLCLISGALFRPACALLFVTMCVAANMHFAKGEGFGKASHALELAVLFGSLFLIGAGNYRVRIGR
jgi:putative oxidoreductase